MSFVSMRGPVLALAIGAAALLAGCERLPMEEKQLGYRGTGMEQVTNPRIVAKNAALHVAPDAQPPASADGPRAKEIYKNVQVLGDLSVGEFTRLMLAMTQWVSPTEGCTYCHNGANFEDDSKYTKIVARRMVQMTQHVNADWKNHVAETGVTCYTCHRGKPVPNGVWFAPEAQPAKYLLSGDRGQNMVGTTVGMSSLPYDPFSKFLLGDAPIRVNTGTALPTDNPAGTKSAEDTYGLMMHFSEGLGVNCTYCHNSRSFASWEGPPQRVTAYYGIRMARDLNKAYMEPLTATFPANRLGPTGDVAKVACATCHQGVNKPLNGAPMLKSHPELAKPSAAAPAASAASAAAAATVTPAVRVAQAAAK